MDTIQVADSTWETSFPHRVMPRPDEWLAGVILRCDEVNDWDSGTTITALLRKLHLDREVSNLCLVLPPSPTALRPLAEWLAVSEPSLLATTYQAELARLYETPHPSIQLFPGGKGVQFCPACLAEERLLRRIFALPHIRCCPFHQIQLQSICTCSMSMSPPKTGFIVLDKLVEVSYETGVAQRIFSRRKKPFVCRACGLDWTRFPRVQADPKLLLREQKILAWYDFFFSKGSLRVVDQILQMLSQTLEQRRTKRITRLDGSQIHVTFSSAEKTTLGRLVDILVSLDLSPDMVETEEPTVLWRPLNRQVFYCPMPACPHMGLSDTSCEARRNEQ